MLTGDQVGVLLRVPQPAALGVDGVLDVEPDRAGFQEAVEHALDQVLAVIVVILAVVRPF